MARASTKDGTGATRAGTRTRRKKAPPGADAPDLFVELQAILAEKQAVDAIQRGLVATERAFGTRTVFAVVHEPALDRLNVSASRGRRDARVEAAAPGDGPVGLAYSTRTVQVADRGALVAVPMIAFGRAIGVLVLLGGSFSGDGQPASDLPRLQSLANACGAAADAARTRHEAERRSRDIEAAAERLREADRTRDTLLSGISHELRTPLTTIKGYLGLALKGSLGEMSPRQRDAMAVCVRNADRLLRLINDLLLTARLDAGKMTLDPKPLGLRGVLDEATQFLSDDARTAGVQVLLRAGAGEVFVRGNRDRLVEGFMHLLERGLRGRREGAKIEVMVGTKGRTGAIEIEMPGVTVADGEVSTIFDAFRSSGGSSNMGLAIAKQILELHGGALMAQKTGNGLLLQATLPLFAGAVSEAARPPSARTGEILIVEDDADCRNAVIDYLKAEHYPVRAFAEGKSALERIQQVPPALVLLDLRIPGVDGAALVKAVREGDRGERTPIFVISGAIDSQAGADTAWGERVDGIFEKPLNYPYLVERIREYVAPATGEVPAAPAG